MTGGEVAGAGIKGEATTGEAVRRAAETAEKRGLTDRMGQLNHPRGGRIGRWQQWRPASPNPVPSRYKGRACYPQMGVRNGTQTLFGELESALLTPRTRSRGASAGSVRGYHNHQAYATETGVEGAGVARGRAVRAAGPAGRPGATGIVRPEPHSSVARVQPRPEMPAEIRRGSTVGMPDWERWLTFCARIDGFPAAPLDPQRRHARDRRAADRHRAAGAGNDAGPRRRPVRQARRRDAQADQARPARPGDAGRDRRDARADRERLRGLRRPRSAAGGCARSLRDAPGRGYGRRLPGREPGPDADAAQVEAGQPGRPGGGGRDHSARARSRATQFIRTCAAGRGSSRSRTCTPASSRSCARPSA